jgi:hypothetical protein
MVIALSMTFLVGREFRLGAPPKYRDPATGNIWAGALATLLVIVLVLGGFLCVMLHLTCRAWRRRGTARAENTERCWKT